ncbi:MAG: acetyl-CoA decarbonylase/synthase complex subunit gamma, partial [Actinobacteria bacterium]|nr:acetyl-CoA decarbonylase/synthase complex subunit gamma [Actinomycetota bacterium]
MALSGLEIFKKLPKTNCKDCGFPTCLAFAMQLAAGKVELEKCPHVSDDAKESLSEASQPPILKVEIGSGDGAFVIGEETVLFRHDRTFVNQNAFAVTVSDDMPDEKIELIVGDINNISYERVGMTLALDAVCVKNKSGDRGKFMAAAEKVNSLSKKPMILVSADTAALKEAAEKFKDKKPLLHGATKDNIDDMISIGKDTGCPIVIIGSTADEVMELTAKARETGIKNMIIDIGSRKLKDDFRNQVILRSAAIKKQERSLGYPTIVFPDEMTDDPQ